jgi:hypothetical protein
VALEEEEIRMRIQGMLVLAGLLALAGCDKGADGAKPAGSTAPAGVGAKTSLTQQQLDDAFKLADADHYDKSLAAVTAKLGAPQKSDAESATWYGTTDGGCYRLLLTKSKGNETGTTDASSCK